MVNVHLYREGRGLVREAGMTIADAWRARDGNTLWIDVEDPSPGEVYALVEVCGFHHLSVEDCLAPVQPPKVDEFPDVLFLVFRGIRRDEETGEVDTYKLAAFLGDRFLVTVHVRPVVAVASVATLVAQRDLAIERHVDRVLHAIVDRMVDDLLPLLDRLEERLEELEESVFSRPTPEALQEILRLKRTLLTVRRTAHPQREMLGRLSRRDLPFIDEQTAIYFRDVFDHMARIEESAIVLADLATGTMDAHLSMASNRLNEIVKVLTIFSAIWMPLTFLAGVYGMNFEFLPELKLRWFYPALWGVWAVIAAGMLLYFRRKRWI